MWKLREYRYASSAAQAVAMLRQGPGQGRYIAGGTDLYLFRPAQCDFVVDINGAGLDDISHRQDGSLYLGATVTMQQLATSPLVQAHAGGAVARSAQQCGNRPVRTVATLGGNICHAVPSADMAPILLSLDGRAHFTDGRTLQDVPLQDFFTGPKQTVLGDQLLVGVSLPAGTAGWRAAFWKLSRTVEDISLVHVAVALELRDSRVQAVRIALGAVAPVPRRAERAEAILKGLDLVRPPSGTAVRGAADAPGEPAGEGRVVARIAEAARAAAAAAEPITDHRASADYRRAMVEVMVRRLVSRLILDPGKALP